MINIKFGLISKFIISVSLIIVLAAAIHGFFLFQLENLQAVHDLKERGEVLARSLASGSEYGILARNKSILERLVKSVVEDEEVAYAQIFDAEGNLLAMSSRKIESGVPVLNVESPIKSIKMERPAEEIGLEPLAPAAKIREETIGSVKLGISHAVLFRERSRLLFITLVLSFSIIAAGLLGVYFMTKYLLIVPLRHFVTGTQKIAQGDLSHKIIIESHDEVGKLAASFNAMTADLKRSKDEIESYTRTLEGMVRERTVELENTVQKLKETTRQLEIAKTGLEEEVKRRTEELAKEKASLEEKVAERTAELQERLHELQIFHDATVGRELKMMELEKEVDALLKELGREPRYT